MPDIGSNTTRPHRLTDVEVSGETIQFATWYRDLWRRYDRMPTRNDTDPLDVPDLLPWLWIYERTLDGDFLCRFAGHHIDVRWQKPSIQFRKLSDILPKERHAPVVNRIETCFSQKCIAHGWTDAADAGSNRRVERCFAPLSGEAGHPEAIIGIALYGGAIERSKDLDAPRSVLRVALYHPLSFCYVDDVA